MGTSHISHIIHMGDRNVTTVIALENGANVYYRQELEQTSSPSTHQKMKAAQRAWLKYRGTGLVFAIEFNRDLPSTSSVLPV